MSGITEDDKSITMFEQGISALLIQARLFDDGVQANTSADRLQPLATALRTLLSQTLEQGKPLRAALTKGTLPALSMAQTYLDDAVGFMERGKTREQVRIQSKA